MKTLVMYIQEGFKFGKNKMAKTTNFDIQDISNYIASEYYNNTKAHVVSKIYNSIDNKFGNKCSFERVEEDSKDYNEIKDRIYNYDYNNRHKAIYDMLPLIDNDVILNFTEIWQSNMDIDEFLIIFDMKNEKFEIYKIIK